MASITSGFSRPFNIQEELDTIGIELYIAETSNDCGPILPRIKGILDRLHPLLKEGTSYLNERARFLCYKASYTILVSQEKRKVKTSPDLLPGLNLGSPVSPVASDLSRIDQIREEVRSLTPRSGLPFSQGSGTPIGTTRPPTLPMIPPISFTGPALGSHSNPPMPLTNASVSSSASVTTIRPPMPPMIPPIPSTRVTLDSHSNPPMPLTNASVSSTTSSMETVRPPILPVIAHSLSTNIVALSGLGIHHLDRDILQLENYIRGKEYKNEQMEIGLESIIKRIYKAYPSFQKLFKIGSDGSIILNTTSIRKLLSINNPEIVRRGVTCHVTESLADFKAHIRLLDLSRDQQLAYVICFGLHMIPVHVRVKEGKIKVIVTDSVGITGHGRFTRHILECVRSVHPKDCFIYHLFYDRQKSLSQCPIFTLRDIREFIKHPDLFDHPSFNGIVVGIPDWSTEIVDCRGIMEQDTPPRLRKIEQGSQTFVSNLSDEAKIMLEGRKKYLNEHDKNLYANRFYCKYMAHIMLTLLKEVRAGHFG